MRLSFTSYSRLCANPEEFRLSKGLGLVPTEKTPALERGSRMHYRAEQLFHGFSDIELEARCDEENMSKAGREAGDALWPSLRNWIEAQQGKLIASEPSIIVPIGRHELECRIDGIRDTGFMYRVHEYKSKGKGWGTYDKQLKEIETEERASTQPICELIAAEHMGYPGRCLDWVVVREPNETGGTPLVFHVPAARSDYDIAYFKRSFVMVCDMVEMWIDKYGLEKPWPHWIHSQWNCDMKGRCNNGWCAYKDVCGTEIGLTEVPDGFERRPIEQTLIGGLKL